MSRFISLLQKAHPPTHTFNSGSKPNYQKLASLLDSITNPKVLVIGSGKSPLSNAARYLGERYRNKIINLEIAAFPAVDVVGDAHQLPFKDASIHGIVIDAVLEHVQNPGQIVDEIYRVLKIDGYVYAEVPFLQGFHADPYDNQRYTLPGLVLLFSKFERIDSGVCAGPSSALCWILTEQLAILFSFSNDLVYRILRFLFGWVTFWIKYLDIVAARGRHAYKAAAGVYLLGKRPSD